MPIENTFERTACFAKEKMSDGKFKITRIPWDLINYGDNFFVSSIPMSEGFDGRTQTATYIPDVIDMLNDPGNQGLIDNVTKFEFFDSEADFTSRFDNVFGFYTSDSGQSREFGY